MKHFLITLLFYFSCSFLYAQQDRFIYLQTDNKQPFFVKLDNKIFNSSPSGYLIIPQLSEGLYSMVIGFALSNVEQEFNCSVKNKDIGYIIRSRGENKFQLVNVQTLSTIVPGDVATKPVITYEKVSDPFSTMLANAVHDSTILRKEIVEIIPQRIEVIAADTAKEIIASTPIIADVKQSDSVKEIPTDIIARIDTIAISKDTVHTVIANPEVAKVEEIPKVDSVKTEIPIEVIAEERSIVINQKDSLKVEAQEVVTIPPIIISDTSAVDANPVVATKSQIDSVQKVTATNEVAIKSKRSKSRNRSLDENPVVINESNATIPVVTDTGLLQQNPPLIATAEKGSASSKKKKSKEIKEETVQDIQPDIAKTLDPPTATIKKDSVFIPVTNNELATSKSNKRKSRTVDAGESKDVMTVKTKVSSLPSIESSPTVETQKNETSKTGSIKRKSRKTTKEGMEMTYVDDQVKFKDTINLLIPSDQKKNTDVAKKQSKIATPVFLEDRPQITVKTKTESSNKKEEISKSIPIVKATMVNSDCKNFANADDYLKTRRKMVAEDEELDMVKAARKVFKTKCFTTEQIKNLSVLFLKDEGKFMFFDAAYAFVSDSEAFFTLEKQLTEIEYINRFKAMVKK